MELGLREIKEWGWVVSLEVKQTVIASYWRVPKSHIRKSPRVTEFRQPILEKSHLEMSGILVQLDAPTN